MDRFCNYCKNTKNESNFSTIRKICKECVNDRSKKHYEANKEKILMELNEYLTENRDRQLFDLPNIEEN